jgi:hypothetical protein
MLPRLKERNAWESLAEWSRGTDGIFAKPSLLKIDLHEPRDR